MEAPSNLKVYGARSEMTRIPPATGPESASRISASLYYGCSDNANDFEAATAQSETALKATLIDDPSRAAGLQSLFEHLFFRYKQTGNIDDLDATIAHCKMAVATTSTSDPNRTTMLHNLSLCLWSRCEQSINTHDLEAVISHTEMALAETSTEHPGRAFLLNLLSISLARRYDQIGNIGDLQTAITYVEMALAANPNGYIDRETCLQNLSNHLFFRYKRTSNLNDLEAAIAYSKMAVTATPIGHADQGARLLSLSLCQSSFYERTGSVNDLNAAITSGEMALKATATNHTHRRLLLNNISIRLFSRYDRTGSIDDLDDAITNAEMALAITSPNHPDQVAMLNNLSNHLECRYKRTGNVDDLEAAINYAKMALQAPAINYTGRSTLLNIMSLCQYEHYHRTGNANSLIAAITHAEMALNITPSDHTDRAARLNNMSLCLSSRYKRSGNVKDIEAAIIHTERAIAITPIDHPDRAGRVQTLSNHLASRYERTGDSDDLEAAVHYSEMAVAITPTDHPDRADWLMNMCFCFFTRYQGADNVDDLKTALECATAAARCENGNPLVRLQAARHAVRILESLNRWVEASILAETALQLLPSVCSRYLTRNDQLHAVDLTAGLAADTCSLFLLIGQPDRALQQLEFGRGLILGYLIDSRSDLGRFEKDCPHLAQEYNRLRHILSRPLPPADSDHNKHLLNDRKKAPRELESCLAKIRQQKGYERFLLEPAIDDLKGQASDGPIAIINVTDLSSDAIIVFETEITHFKLEDLTKTTFFAFQDQLRRFRAVGQCGPRDMESEIPSHFLPTSHATFYNNESLHWLWSTCVSPIVENIESHMPTTGSLPRIWWIGTGVAGSIPFHAAGDHFHQTENLVSRAISSYTPTIKALAYSRSCIAKLPPHPNRISVCIVAMPTTPNNQPLPGVSVETDVIKDTAGGIYTIDAQHNPTSELVLHKLDHTDIIHFACHGFSDLMNPSRSHLLLQKNSSLGPEVDRLTVQQISDSVFKRARIAYLSACSTAEVAARRFTDEAIHLASAFQVAGFGHVIASLWSLDDAICARVASCFYKHLVRNTKNAISDRLIAEALHAAVAQIRPEVEPRVWASFIHYGA